MWRCSILQANRPSQHKNAKCSTELISNKHGVHTIPWRFLECSSYSQSLHCLQRGLMPSFHHVFPVKFQKQNVTSIWFLLSCSIQNSIIDVAYPLFTVTHHLSDFNWYRSGYFHHIKAQWYHLPVALHAAINDFWSVSLCEEIITKNICTCNSLDNSDYY